MRRTKKAFKNSLVINTKDFLKMKNKRRQKKKKRKDSLLEILIGIYLKKKNKK